MPTYRAYGLVINSEFPIPELERVRGSSDVHVCEGEISNTPNRPVEDCKLYRVPDGYYVTVTGVGSLLATAGRKLIVDPAPTADRELVRHVVLGQGFRALLHQRGYFVLHGSATVVDGRAVAFLGDSGQGKSTTISAFYAENYPVLTDDVTAVDPDTLSVIPGFSRIKLDRQAAESIDTDLTTVESGDIERQYYIAGREKTSEPVSLGGLYLLDDGPEVRIETIPPSERPYRLMCESASTYHSADDEAVEPHLDTCVRLSESVPVKRLERPRQFDALPSLVRAVEADVAGTTERAASSERETGEDEQPTAEDERLMEEDERPMGEDERLRGPSADE